ncbi:MAG TPA: o-succinylbenzoate synthase [Pyrinomonadaceae bacterium]|nr:o-succinylbenzoate synthase [Pyrinomonadaceae bacterium]
MTKLQLERIELREIELPLKSPFETSFGRTTRRRILIVRAFDKDGAYGYGECVAPEDPFYNHETVDTAWLITAKYVAPLLTRARVETAREVNAALAPIRGNQMAKAGVEVAVWDLEAKLACRSLWQHLGGVRDQINCGVSIGLQETTEALIDKVAHELESGYQRIKIKIKPGKDVQLVEAIRTRFPSITLSVDANSAYSLNGDLSVFKQLDQYNLLMIEQPLAPGDLVDHAKLQREIKTPICLDESIVRLADARQAHELGSCRIINIKLGRVGGHTEVRLIQAYAVERDIPVWCGGMLEAGIGRAHNIALSTLPGFTLPGDVSASERYWEEDIIEPPVTVSRKGTIKAPTGHGIGYEVNEARIESLTVRRETVHLTS